MPYRPVRRDGIQALLGSPFIYVPHDVIVAGAPSLPATCATWSPVWLHDKCNWPIWFDCGNRPADGRGTALAFAESSDLRLRAAAGLLLMGFGNRIDGEMAGAGAARG